MNRGPTHWSFVELDGEASGAGPIGGAHTCRDCREPTAVLHADPRSSDPRRTVCGGCAGHYLRERVGWAKAAES